MLPRISEHYNLNDLQVSYIFLVNPIGYILASQSNSAMHCWFGQRGIAIVSPILHIISAVMIAVHPPFPVLLLGFAVMNFGSGFLDGSWCAWAGSMNRANLVSGLLHGSFSAGAAAGPFFAGLWMGEGTNWWEWYYFLVSAKVLQFGLSPNITRFFCYRSIDLSESTRHLPRTGHGSILPTHRSLKLTLSSRPHSPS